MCIAKFKPAVKTSCPSGQHFNLLTAVLFALVMGGYVIALSGCTPLDDGEEVQKTTEAIPDMELFKSTISRQSAGQATFLILSGRMYTFVDKPNMFLDDSLQVDFYDDNGNHTAVLNALKGEIQEQTTWMLAQGDVVIRSDSGYVLRTSYLEYNPKEDKILSDSFVTFVTPYDSLTGYGFQSTSDLKEWSLKQTSGTTFRKPSRRRETVK